MRMKKTLATITLGFIIATQVSLVYASVTNSANFNLVGNVDQGNIEIGLKFTVNNSTYITQVNKTAGTAVSFASIVDSGLNRLATASFSGNVATFSGNGVAITAGQTYYVTFNNAGSAHFVTDYNLVNSDLPSNNTDINFPATGNCVFQAPYSATITAWSTGNNGTGIVSVITSQPVTTVPMWAFWDF